MMGRGTYRRSRKRPDFQLGSVGPPPEARTPGETSEPQLFRHQGWAARPGVEGIAEPPSRADPAPGCERSRVLLRTLGLKCLRSIGENPVGKRPERLGPLGSLHNRKGWEPGPSRRTSDQRLPMPPYRIGRGAKSYQKLGWGA